MSETMENPILGAEGEVRALERLQEKLYEVAQKTIDGGSYEGDVAHVMQRTAIEVNSRGR